MDANYIVSARKYRPMTFESVVGQTPLTQTLQSAIRQKHLAHAYLFCGPRGVGKTTCARIFAKTINCLHPTENYDACNECESCRAFNEQRSFNIHELDAASNNSVEDIRTLIAEVRIPPQQGKYSVYIIDEVHMLSQGAFNALLKTLEEPPSYVIFILATTEKHKVLPTILSRCQVFDFARITVNDTIAHLQQVAQKEGITVAEEALNVVAQKADGGMRDALSIFDQLVSFCGTTITYEQTIEVLNVLNSDYYFRTVDLALQHDVSGVLLLLNEVLVRGFEAGNFVVGLAAHLRNVLVAKDEQTAALLESSDAVRRQYIAQGAKCSPQWIFAALDILNTCDIHYRTSRNKRLTVELALIKMTQLGLPTTDTPPTTTTKTIPTTPPTQTTQTTTTTKTIPTTPPTQTTTTTIQVPTMPTIPAMGVSFPKKSESLPDTNVPSPATPRTTPFTKDRLNDAWVGLISVYKDEPRLKNLCSFYHPVLTEPLLANIELSNPIDYEAMKRYLPTITNYIHNALQNDMLQFSLSRAHYDPTIAAYTNEERYQAALKENENLATLRTILELQID